MATISSLKEKIRSPFAKGKENTRKIQLMLEETLTKNVQLQRVNRSNFVNQTGACRELFSEQIQISRFQLAILRLCLVTWPMNASEVGSDLALTQTSLFFSFKCKLVSIRTT